MDGIPLGILSLAFFVLLLACAFLGQHLAQRTRTRRARGGGANPRAAEPEPELSGFVVGAHLGLVSFMIAISFGASMSRLDVRRNLVVTEANAIGTAELRSRMLSPDLARRIRNVLIEYCELRAVELPEGHVSYVDAMERSDALLRELWSATLTAVKAGAETGVPDAPLLMLFVGSVNDVIDTGTRRVYVLLEDRIPLPIWAALALISLSAFVTLGYDRGLRPRRLTGMPALALALALVFALIEDLDRPHVGLSRIDQSAMLSTLEDMRRYDAAGGHRLR